MEKRNILIQGDFSITELKQKDTRKKAMTAEEKIEALKKAGVDTDGFFSMKGANGGDAIARLVNGKLEMLDDDDPILAAIREDGEIPDSRLYRRWVLAQIMHMIVWMKGNPKMSFVDCMAFRGGYEYQWKVLENEFHAQYKMEANKDGENLKMRNIWYNKTLALSMFDGYMSELKKQVENYVPRKYKGKPYVKIHGKNYFLDNIDAELYKPMAALRNVIVNAKTARVLWLAVKRVNAEKVRLSRKAKMSNEFIDAYKGCGSYYAMRNLLMFHGMKMAVNGIELSGNLALEYLDCKTVAFSASHEGWRLLGMLKELMEHNNFDISKKLAEWSAEKVRRQIIAKANKNLQACTNKNKRNR
ncbi:MAG: ubiquitin carboxyl-hydrolase [Prevotella sp.]|nr:ubiquitin carboxyl-hydrolase [Prevotella sp.]